VDHVEVGRYWDRNAENWTLLSRQGYDVLRDHVNTPAFLDLLPPVAGQRGLDIGCGEGTNTRRVAALGARMTAVDISEAFLRYAREAEAEDPLGVDYRRASAVDLPFPDGALDFCTSFMCLMDLPEQDAAIAEAARVLRPGGFLQFSICHPCFHTPRWRWLTDDEGERDALVVGEYFTAAPDVEEWTFSTAPPEARAALPRFEPFRVPRFPRTLSAWLNGLLDAGLALERFCEPTATEAALAACPKLHDTRLVAYVLIVRARKPT